ncbi:hypothetical protein [Hymenobacter convexus]|uniref:hypothetical protein n=1 Tax=Hymenobacter sp. CA1UV-4 TaxID=3063782 RepID=UPI002713314D|nr:hypothetical protein [Hymenobacter sp. CA1UV-4]MDO7853847.1 hypothetical protein [Hymenobacter sp. CA1UV-4]
MIQPGHWKGQYTFGNPAHNKLRGFELTTFYIDITSVDGHQFSGTVEDDLSTGGTEGIGEITGKVSGDFIEFVKQMPVKTVIEADGRRSTYNKKHRKLYYSGKMAADGKSISGSWRFRSELIWVGLVPHVSEPVGGTWSMALVG